MPRVPIYSEGMGQLALPKERLAGLSAQAISNLGAPGRALEQFGATAQQTFSQLASVEMRIEEKRQTDEGRIWVLNKRNELMAEAEQHKNDLLNQTAPSDYLGDKSAAGSPDPNSFTSKRLDWYEKTLAGDRYKAPSKIAGQMWAEESMRIKGQLTVDAIKTQAAQRTAALKTTVETSLTEAQLRVQRNPITLSYELAAWDKYLAFKDDPNTPQIEGVGGSLGKNYLDATRRMARTALADSALVGLIEESPLQALKIIDKGMWDDGKMYGIQPERISTLRKAAISALQLNNEANLAALQDRMANHFASLSKGGTGDSAFGSAESTLAIVTQSFGDPEIAQYIPGIKPRIDRIVKDFESKSRIARTSGQLMKSLEYATDEQLVAWMRSSRDVGKGKVVNVEEIVGKNGAYKASGLSSLTTAEQVEVVDKVNTLLSQRLQERAKDPGGFVLNNDWVQSQVRKNPTDFQSRKSSMDAVYEQMRTPVNQRAYLTTAEATAEVAKFKDQKINPDMLIMGMKQLEEKYGSAFPSVWSQLTTMQDGLDSRYMFLGAVIDTPAARVMAEALLTDPKQLKDMFDNNMQAGGTTYGQIETAIRAGSRDLIYAMTGGLPNRVNDVAPLYDLLTRATALSFLSTKSGGTPQQAVENLMRSFQANGAINIISDDKLNLLLTPEHRASDGTPVLAALENLKKNAGEMLSSRVSIQSIAAATGQRFVVPGSLDPAVGQDPQLRFNYFMDKLREEGRFVVSDDGNGMMLVYPSYYGSTMSPVMVEGHGRPPHPLVLPFDAFMLPPERNVMWINK